MTQQNFLKNFIILVIVILAALSIYFSSYLPLAKSRLFIKSLRTAGEIKTLEGFEKHFDEVFNFYSPIGSEEVAKFLSSDVMNIVSQQQSEEVSLALIKYIEPKMMRNNIRHLLVLAQAYQTLWQKTNKANHLGMSLAYYKSAYKIGPKLPPVLYGLLQTYINRGDIQGVRDTAMAILSYWPDDGKVKEILTIANKR